MKNRMASPFLNLDKGAMMVMAFGIAMVGQPWSHFLFRYGFAVILIGLLAYAISSRSSNGSHSIEAMDGEAELKEEGKPVPQEVSAS